MVDTGHIEIPKTKTTIKLRMDDYNLYISNTNIIHTELSYVYDKVATIIHKDGKKVCEKEYELLVFELAGKTVKDESAYVQFSVRVTIDDLYKFEKNKIIDISELLDETESYLAKPGEHASCLIFNLPTNTIRDMYYRFTNLKLYRMDDDTFIFRLDIPNEVFAYFKIKFDK